jgi:hypothetical protein
MYYPYRRPRRFLWYLASLVLILFIIKDPTAAAHLARGLGDLLGAAADALCKLVGTS